jgi:diaminopimelate decarboxylase
MPGIEVVGLGCHIGSQLTRSSPYVEAAARLVALSDRLREEGIALHHLDFGGGIGIRYQEEAAEPVSTFLDGVLGLAAGRPETVIVDPGRSIVGNAGVIVTRVEYVKSGAARNFLIVDAAMNDLLRPALYGAWHGVQPVRQPESGARPAAVYDVVGPVCESADFLAKERPLHAGPGDLLALMSAGAYAAAMGSNYNSRPRPAEVLVEGDRCRLVRRRETVDELFALERFPA